MLDQIKEEINMLETRLLAFQNKRKEIQQSEQYADKYKQELLAKHDADRQSKIDESFALIEKIITQDVASAKKKATPPEFPFDQKNYELNAATMDVDGNDPDKWLGMYQAAIDNGNLARKAELKRVLNARIDGGHPLYVKWYMLLQDTRTPAEVEYQRVVAEEAQYRGCESVMKAIIRDGAAEPAGKPGTVTNWQSLFDRMAMNAKMNAGE